MELQIENLKALIKGVELNNYQRALALQEWSNLLGYVKDLEQLNTPLVMPELPDFGLVEMAIWDYYTTHNGTHEMTDETSYHNAMECLKPNFDYIQGRKGN